MNNMRAPANPIDAPGTTEATWRAWPGLARLPALDVTPWTSAVVVAAHPDDEVLGPGAGPVLAPAFVSHFLRNDELLLPVEPS
jgi:hypothetical protein